MDTKTRRADIAIHLQRNGEVSITDMAQRHGRSEMTIRRDLDVLESEGLARLTRGGAICVRSRAYEPPILQRAAHRAEAKRRIGEAAAALVSDGDTVVLDVGTTVHALAREIPGDVSVTVVTSSLWIASELGAKGSVRTIVTGGVVRPGEMSLVGPRAESAYDDLNCDIAFLGVAGISDAKGLSEYSIDDANVKRAALAAVRRVVVLADATKVGRVALVTFAPISVVDVLVTDASPDDEVIRRLRERGVDVVHVEPKEEESP